MRESIRANGFFNPPLVQQSRMRILAGEHRWRAATAEGLATIPVTLLDVDDDQARRILLMDNKSADDATYDPESLQKVLADVMAAQADLLGTGWSTIEYEALIAAAAEEVSSFRDGEDVPLTPDTTSDEGRGSMLSLADVTIGEPSRLVVRGDVWRLGHHRLFCCDVMRQWEQWSSSLVAGVVFIPYPGVFVALSEQAAVTPFVMVQPNPYLAGHVLDKYAAVHGPDSVAKVEQ